MDKHKIVAIIGGEKHTLNKVGEPDPDMVDDPCYKLILRDYVLNNFKEECESKDDIEEIKYYNGRKLLFKFDYSEDIFNSVKKDFMKFFKK